MKLTVHTKGSAYDIFMEHGILHHAKDYAGSGHFFLISDDGVPQCWRNILQSQFPESRMHVFPQGEASKNFDTLQAVLGDMLDAGLSRKDTVIALGGGVVGDLSGFAASLYMRGIRYINIPTTMLAMVDSSIGGKTAVDFHGVKNSVGSFWQPSLVLIDPDVLSTLSPRLLHEGLAESVKMGLTHDARLFELFEREDYESHIDEIIERSLRVKQGVVERDERESGERKMLNFGHTYGHAFESYHHMDRFLHGECVALGMMKVIRNRELKDRVKAVLERLELPVSCEYDPEEIVKLVMKDKKADHGEVTFVQVDEPGNGYLVLWREEDIRKGLEI